MMEVVIAVVGEAEGGRVSGGSREAVAFVRRLSTPARVIGVLLSDSRDSAAFWAQADGIEVMPGLAPGLKTYEQRSFLSALIQVLDRVRPSLVVVPHTARGSDFAPRLAARLRLPFTPSVCGLDEGETSPLLIRQVMGGKVIERIELPEAAVLTVAPGAFTAEVGSAPGMVREVEVNPDPPAARVMGRSEPPTADAGLARAEVIVAVGRGAGETGIPLGRELAACFRRGALGSSRPLVDAGLLPYELQVGQTGATVAPRVYIACGISGALQHTAGMSGANFIVAVNTDANAPIFRLAHLGAVMDLRELLPELIERLRSMRGSEQ